MGDLTVLLAIASLVGGLIAWVISEVRRKYSNKADLERRISAIESKLDINRTNSTNYMERLSDILDALKELKAEVRTVDERTRENEIQLARIEGRND
ncbi:hypothetical protein ACLH2J_01835 [Klebsiella michiganensis]|uniref:hypothetical protein n=1 Tax=Klebsiella michiganensis TaxID=1134687 RepID=UPI0039839323